MFNALLQEVKAEMSEEGDKWVIQYGICTPGIYWVYWMDENGIHQQKIQVENPVK